MITLRIIQIVYAIVAVLITLGGLIAMFKGGGGRGYGGYGGYDSGSFIPGGPVMGLIVLIFGNIMWRMWCELIIVFFRINKTLNSIDEKTKA
jgi:hypothetical protein